MMFSLENFLIFVTVIARVQGSPPRDALHPDPKIVLINPEEQGYRSTYPVVHGVRSCGGHGKLISLRGEECPSPNSLCEYPADNKTRAWELAFVPSADAAQIGLKFVLYLDDNTKIDVYKQPIANSAVHKGKPAIIKTWGSVSDALKGRTVLSHFSAYRLRDVTIETCAESDYFVY